MNNLIWHDFTQIPSTHTHAIDLVTSTIISKPVLITADMQTAGYGTNNRTWESALGNLFATFCILEKMCNFEKFHVKLKNHEQPTQAIICANILQKTILTLTGKTLELKEPNDLLYKGKKCSGVMVSKIQDSSKQPVLCISIGFNCARGPKTSQPTTYIKCNKHELIFSWIYLLCGQEE